MEPNRDQDAQITMLSEIIGLNRETAQRALSLHENNFEAALNSFLGEPEQIPSTSAGLLTTDSNVDLNTGTESNESDYVRDPILPKRETLLLPEEDNFLQRKKRIKSHLPVCPLRNFELEGRLQEERIEAISKRKISNAGHNDANGIENNIRISKFPKRSRLDHLYRPPVEICFSGSFQAARDFAQMQNRWLLVNVQDNSSFQSQILNRDIWSSCKIRDILKAYFVFWQIAIDNVEGIRFKTFYDVKNLPYVCVIDPRTGEKKTSYENNFEENELVTELTNFLSTTSKQPSMDHLDIQNECQNQLKASNSEPVSLSEDEQIAIAIANSLRESGYRSDEHDSDNQPNSMVNDEESCDYLRDEPIDNHSDDNNYITYLGSSTDPVTRLQLRLPEGAKHVLEWPCTTKLKALKLFIINQFPDIASKSFKVISPIHAGRNSQTQNSGSILDCDETLNLKEANLHPSAILHIYIN